MTETLACRSLSSKTVNGVDTMRIMEQTPAKIAVNFAGDVMIGRLIDQLLPTSVHNPEEAAIVQRFRKSRPHLPHLREGKYGYSTPWGDTLGLWRQGNLNIVNLETAVTSHSQLWPDKVFNYRTHPDNVACLVAANLNHVSLANNHTLDFELEGLKETCDSLDRQGVSYVGAGKVQEHALGPVFLDLPLSSRSSSTADAEDSTRPKTVSFDSPRTSSLRVGLLSASDHPLDWSSVPLFHLLPDAPLSAIRTHLAPLIASARSNADLVIFSVHWGPNYRWVPDQRIQELARWMIAEGVDIVHGHSSHHVQGIEIVPLEVVDEVGPTNGLIIYGCGDFVDDYALNAEFRNDLSAVWRVHMSVSCPSSATAAKRVRLDNLSVFPTLCANFQTNRLTPSTSDWKWVKSKIHEMSWVKGKTWRDGKDGDFCIDIC